MLHTRVCDLFEIELPISNAGMGGVALASLAAAVSEAGGIGTLALAGFSLAAMVAEISAARALTKQALGVNLLVPFLRDGTFELLAAKPIDAVTLFWGDPSEVIPRAKAAGLRRVVWQCGSAAEAQAAKRAGADAIIAQGFEAGGHVRGTVTTLALIPEVRDAYRRPTNARGRRHCARARPRGGYRARRRRSCVWDAVSRLTGGCRTSDL
jgi:nitronate monooxygenase